jgi:elongation factor G
MSSGRAQFSMVFSHYAPVPSAIADEIKEKLAG